MFSTRSRGGQLGRDHSPAVINTLAKVTRQSAHKLKPAIKLAYQPDWREMLCTSYPWTMQYSNSNTCKWPRRIHWFVPISPYTPATCRVWSFSPRDTVSGLPRIHSITQGSDESHHGQWNNLTLTTSMRYTSQHWVNSRVPLRPQIWCTLCPHDLPWYIK